MKLAIHLSAAAITAALCVMASPVAATARDTARGGATDLIKQTHLTKAGVAVTLTKPSHSSLCPKCQTQASAQKVTEGKGNVTRSVVVEKHLCGDCMTKIVHEGHGKAQVNRVVHVCAATSGASASCCVK